jgi:transposase
MPRNSPFPIVLSADEEHRLQQIARNYTSPYCDVVRVKVALLAAQGLQNRQIGERLDLPRQIVCKWRKRFFEERLAGLAERPRRGRPRDFSPSGRRGS